MSDVATSLVPNTSGPTQATGAQPETVEPQTDGADAAPVETEKPKVQDFLAPKFAALSRKEKEVRAEAAKIKAEREEIAKMRAELEGKSKTSADSEAKMLSEFKKNPLKFMQSQGLSFEQLMEMQLNDQNPTPQMMIEQLKSEMDSKYQKELSELRESLKEKETREANERYEAAKNGYLQELTGFVNSNPDTYELILANGATELMYETAEAYFQQTGKVPSHKEIAQAVEEHLEERAKQILKLKKFQTPAPKIEAKPSGQPTKTAPTLSNTLAAEVPQNGTKFMSDEESKKAAAKLLRWEE